MIECCEAIRFQQEFGILRAGIFDFDDDEFIDGSYAHVPIELVGSLG